MSQIQRNFIGFAEASSGGSGGGISDGDKGDVIVSGAGAIWLLDTAIDAAKIANGTVSNAEFQYLDGVTSGIQSQLNGKQASGTYSTDIHTNITALNAVSGTNTGDQDLSGYSLTSHNHTGTYAPALGIDDNYVTDAEKVVIGNTSGTNTGDNAVNSNYSSLVTNATHTGDVTGSTTLTIDPTAITGKTAVTALGTDYILISDTSDTGAMKKALISDLMGKTLSFTIGDGVNAITTGVAGDIPVPFNCTITGWYIVADASGSIVIDVWKDTFANFPATVADTIAGTEKPTLSSAVTNSDTTLGSFSGSLIAGDWIRLNVDSATTVKRVTVYFTITRN